MFRTGLLISTAMTAVTFVLSGAPTGAYAQTGMHVADRDANARFLCTYGAFAVSSFSSGPSYSSFFSWKRVAVPVIGHGQTVSRIIVKEAKGSGTGEFSAGIYKSNAKGFPGKLIAGSQGSVGRPGCRRVTVPIAPTKLQPDTKYWIVEKADSVVSGTNQLYWAVNPTAKHKAFVQTHFASCSQGTYCYNSSTTPWTEQSSGPWFRLK